MARYTDAVEWLAGNDDNEWLWDEYGSMSVAATLVADVFNKTHLQVVEDLYDRLVRGGRSAGPSPIMQHMLAGEA